MKEGVHPSQYDSIIHRIRTTIAAEHGVSLSSVCLLETRSVPKTTSGKIARSWCRKAFLEGSLKVLVRFDSIVDEAYEVEGLTNNSNVAEAVTIDPVVDAQESRLSSMELRALPLNEIVSQLEVMLIRIAGQNGILLSSPIDSSSPIISFGLDSLTVVQFNGVLHKKFYCILPDDYLFSQHASLTELAQSVKTGGMTTTQKRYMDEGEGDRNKAAPVAPKTPLCPWFTCCY